MEEIDRAYQDALDYLYSFVDYSLTRSFRYSPEKFNLDRMRLLLKKMGNPHFNYPVIHIAGTKGKGSTAAFIASALRASGKKTGFYTSPTSTGIFGENSGKWKHHPSSRGGKDSGADKTSGSRNTDVNHL